MCKLLIFSFHYITIQISNLILTTKRKIIYENKYGHPQAEYYKIKWHFYFILSSLPNSISIFIASVLT